MGEVMLHENQMYRDVNYNDYTLSYQSYMDNSHSPTMQVTNSYGQYSVKNLLNLVDDAHRKEEIKCPSFDLPAITDHWFPASFHQPLPNFGPQWQNFVAEENVKTISSFQKEIRPVLSSSSLSESRYGLLGR